MENAIEVTNLCKRYPDFALENISFTVPYGSIVGIIGENGAGKTTTLRAILGACKPDSGSIQLLGSDPDDAQVKTQLGAAFNDAFFSELMSPVQVRKCLASLQPNFDGAYWDELMNQFQIPVKKVIKDFSQGMRAKLRIAAALSHHPKLLILDEATNGLDPIIRGEILDMLWDFIQDEGHSVLISSHITSDLEKIADSVLFIHKGRLLLQADSTQLLDSFCIVRSSLEQIERLPAELVLARRKAGMGWEALVKDRQQAAQLLPEAILDKSTLEDIMRFYAGRDTQ